MSLTRFEVDLVGNGKKFEFLLLAQLNIHTASRYLSNEVEKLEIRSSKTKFFVPLEFRRL